MVTQIKSKGGRPRNPDRNELHHLRKETRYWVCRRLGLGAYAAREASNCVGRFVETLIAHGKDPAAYGELAVRLLGGKPRTDPERAARYRELRKRGLSAAIASRIAQTPGVTRDALRRLDQGLPLRD